MCSSTVNLLLCDFNERGRKIMGTFIQYIFYLAVLILLAIPLGKYISKAMSGEKVFLSKILAPCERGIYKILHIDPDEDMSWKYAQKEYEDVRSESRQGFAISEEELKRVDAIIAPLVKQGQSIHHICIENADDIMLDEKTIYNYIDAGLLSVGNIDLPRKVRYRVRKKKKPVRVDKQCHVGRTYDDFQEFISANPDVAIVEMDSVEGRKGGKVFLTIYFRSCSLMLAFIRDHNTARSVTEVFNRLYELLGHEIFTTLFPVVLTDRGSEFTDPLSIEFNVDGERRTHVFYCDPQRSDQKGGIEVTHEMIRRVLPKKTSFDNLTQDDVSLMMSHINSYKRKKLGNRSAYQLFSFLHDEGLLEKLGITLIPSKEINLTPLLLKK